MSVNVRLPSFGPIRLRRFLWVLVITLLLATACSGDDDGDDGGLATLDSTADQTADEPASDATLDTEEALLDFAQCIRDNGYPDYPDIALEPDGSIGVGGLLGQLDAAGIDPQSDEFVAALNACSDRLQGIALGLIGEGFDETELQDQLLAFTSCLREQGFDVDDPQLSDFQDDAPAGDGPLANLDLDDPAVRDALDLCRREIAFPGLGTVQPDEGGE